jgi:hypothetical protein
VRSRSGGGSSGIFQRRKPVSDFSWYAFATSFIVVKAASKPSQSAFAMHWRVVATIPPTN